MRGFRLFVSARVLRGAPIAAGAVFILLLALGTRKYPVLFASADMWTSVAPSLPTLWGVIIGFFAVNRMSSVEPQQARLRWCRAAWCAVLFVAPLVLYPLVTMVWPEEYASQYIRNTLLAVGFGLLAACVLGARTAWTASVMLLLIWFFVAIDGEGNPYAWALPQQPVHVIDAEGNLIVSAALSWIIALIMVLISATMYITRDVRPDKLGFVD